MQIKEPTLEQVEIWKKVFEDRAKFLKPNRISGIDLDSYFINKYNVKIIEDDKFLEVVRFNLFEIFPNYKDKFKKEPNIRTYITDDGVYVGIDKISGFFCVESKFIELSEAIYDDLFLKRGLDDEDLKNYFLVYQYVMLNDKELV